MPGKKGMKWSEEKRKETKHRYGIALKPEASAEILLKAEECAMPKAKVIEELVYFALDKIKE